VANGDPATRGTAGYYFDAVTIVPQHGVGTVRELALAG